jgi:hypothetical protein
MFTWFLYCHRSLSAGRCFRRCVFMLAVKLASRVPRHHDHLLAFQFYVTWRKTTLLAFSGWVGQNTIRSNPHRHFNLFGQSYPLCNLLWPASRKFCFEAMVSAPDNPRQSVNKSLHRSDLFDPCQWVSKSLHRSDLFDPTSSNSVTNYHSKFSSKDDDDII